MSRSIPNTTVQNPAVKFFDWSAGKGKLEYYDKETKENVEVKLPFRFLILDVVAQVTGGVKRPSAGGKKYDGYWSNAVRPADLKKRPFHVQSKLGGKEMPGLWADIKGQIKGAKYMTGLYIAFKEGDELQIGYLKIKGSALTAWIEFNKDRRNLEQGAFTLTGKSEPVESDSGGDDYYLPVFSFSSEVSEETEAKAVDLDRELQVYLKAYFAQSGAPEANDNEPEHGDAYEPPASRLSDPPEDYDKSDTPF